jgi:hypothetical protein
MFEETVVYIFCANKEVQKKLPSSWLRRAQRSFETSDGSCISVLGGEAFFTQDATKDLATLRQLVEAGSAHITLDLAHYMQHDAVCKSFEIPEPLLQFATELRAIFKISVYIVSD